ncbi:MAG: bifunctional homocysteine S-methyltransferase/methylenetetrahydrofolate reductase [Lachnospirales bacterium]
MNLREYLKDKKLLCDGAFGTYYAGFGTEKISEKANVSDSENVLKVHRDYIEKGAKLIRTNTFSSNRATLGVDEKGLRENVSKAYDIAKLAAGDSVFVACDFGPCENSEDYYIVADEFLKKGGDIFVFETFSETSSIIPVAEYIKNKNKDCFIIFQFCVNQHGFSESGVSAQRLVEECSNIDFIDAFGFNCGIGPSHLLKIFEKIEINTDKFITALPNASYPSVIQDRVVFLGNIDYFSSVMEKVSVYADIIGGCCGTNPLYTEALSRLHIYAAGRITGVNPNHKDSGINKDNLFFKNKKQGEKIIAVELDPPKGTDCDALMETANYLKNKGVDIITFADSPSGRTRADSVLMSLKVMRETGINVMPHICCRDRNAISISSTLLGAYINDIRNFLVITGDPVPNTSRENVKSVFNFDSVKLMEYIKDMNEENFTGDKLCYGGAINYARRNIDYEVKRALKKEEAGARFFLTQPVFSDEDIKSVKYISSKLKSKVLVGIMPLVSFRNANFIKNEIAGISVPDEVINRFSPDMTKEEGRQVGIEIAKEIMAKVSDFAEGYYFMIPFNRLSIAKELIK